MSWILCRGYQEIQQLCWSSYLPEWKTGKHCAGNTPVTSRCKVSYCKEYFGFCCRGWPFLADQKILQKLKLKHWLKIANIPFTVASEIHILIMPILVIKRASIILYVWFSLCSPYGWWIQKALQKTCMRSFIALSEMCTTNLAMYFSTRSMHP